MKKGYLNQYMKVVAKDVSETINLSITEKIRLNTKEGTNTIKSDTADNINIKAEIGYPVFTSFPFYDETLDTYTDGKTMIYPLPRDQIREDVLDVTNNLETFSKETIVSCDSIVTPDIVLNNIPIDYAYTEDNFNYKGETIEIDRTNIDLERDIEFDSIRGQTFQNLLVEPIINEETNIPIELSGKNMEMEGLESETLVPIREITGDSYMNILEDKIDSYNFKPENSFIGDIMDGTVQYFSYDDLELTEGILNAATGEPTGTTGSNYHYSKLIEVTPGGKIGALAYNGMNLQFYFYKSDKTLLTRNALNSVTNFSIDVPSDTKYIRFYSDFLKPDLKPGWNYFYATKAYNLEKSDKAYIRELKGNTNCYYHSIPVADPYGNMYTAPVKVEGNNILKSDYIYVGNVPNGYAAYFKLYEDGVSTTTTGHGQTEVYDNNLNLLNGSAGYCNLNGTTSIAVKHPYIKVSFGMTSGNLDPSKTYRVSMKIGNAGNPVNFPETIEEPTIIGRNDFPIQTTGGLYTNNSGDPILDSDGNKQYKLDIISSNNLWDGKSWLNGRIYNSRIPEDSYITDGGLYEPYGVKFKLTGSSMRGVAFDNIIIDPTKDIYVYFNHKNYYENGCSIAGANIVFYDEIGNWIKGDSIFGGGLIIDSTNKSKSYLTIPANKIPSNAKNLKFNFYCGNGPTGIDYIVYNVLVTQTQLDNREVLPEGNTKSVILPQQLGKFSDIYKDTLYWDEEKSKYCIKKYVKFCHLDYSSSWKIKQKNSDSFIMTLTALSDNLKTNNKKCGFSSLGTITFSSLWQNIYLTCELFKGFNYTDDDILNLVKDGIDIWYVLATPEIVETNITEKILLNYYDNMAYFYTNDYSSLNDSIPAIENVRGQIVAKTLPLCTRAYIAPNSYYTFSAWADSEIKLKLGGSELIPFNYDNSNENIFNTTTFKENTLPNSNDGTEMYSGNTNTTDFIKIENNIVYNFSTKDNINLYIRIFSYDENKKYIKNIYSGNTNNYNFNLDNTGYFKIAIPSNTNMENITFNKVQKENRILIKTPANLTNKFLSIRGEGTIRNVTLLRENCIDYIPKKLMQNEPLSVGDLQEDGTYKIDIISENINKFNFHNLIVKSNGNSEIRYSEIDNEAKTIKLLDSDNNYLRDSLFSTNFVFKPNKTYTFSAKVETNNANKIAKIVCVSNNLTFTYEGKVFEKWLNDVDENGYVKGSFTIPNDGTDYRLFLNLNSHATLTGSYYILFSEICVYEGKIENPIYIEPKYDVKTIYLPQPLRKIGNTADKLIWDSSLNKMFIEKNIMEIKCKDIDFTKYNFYGFRHSIYLPNSIGGCATSCNKLTSFKGNHEYLNGNTTRINEYAVGMVNKDLIIRTGVEMDTSEKAAKWLKDNDVKIYLECNKEIIETNITERLEIKGFDTDTSFTSSIDVLPNLYLKSDSVIREALISSGESYYVYAKTTGPVDINLGGVITKFNPEDVVKQISIPNVNDISQTIEITGNKQIVTEVMVRKDDRTDIKYFEGLHFVGDPVLVDDVTKYKIKYNIIGGKNILNATDLYNSWKAYGISDANLNLVTFDGRQCIRMMCNGSLFNRNYYFGFIKENTQYTLSFNGYYSNLADPSITDGECLVINTTSDSYVLTSDNANQWNSYVFTNEENTTLESICGANQAANYLFIDIDSIQLEKNLEPTKYTPFQGYVKEYLLNEPLRAIGNVFDELTVEGKVIRRINKQILDADLINLPTTNLYVSRVVSVNFNLFNNQINNIDTFQSNRFISNKIAIGTRMGDRVFKVFGPGTNTVNALVIPNSNLSSNDKAGIIEWLNKNNPITIYYLQYEVIEDSGYTKEDMLLSTNLIECITNSQFPSPYTIINIPYKNIRPIEKPTNLSVESENYTHTISWNGDLGVEEYDVKVGDKLIGTAKYPETSLVTTEEMKGNLTVTARNFLTESLPSDPLAVITLPNSTKITVFRNGFDIDGKRILEFDYSNNSEIATGYKLYYRIDDRSLQTVDLGLNEIPTHRFKVDSITHHIDMKMVAYNSVGETDYVDFKQFLTPPTMDWTYTTSNNSLLIRWFDKATNDSYWRILVYGEDQTLIPATMKNPQQTYAEGETDYNSDKFVTEGELGNITVAGDGAGVEGELREYISLPRDINKNVSLLMVDDEGYEHLVGTPIKMGHSLDLTLLPPKDFTMKWIDPDAGIIEFSWIDNYTKENKFELRYSLNGSQEKVISIPTESKPQQGKKYVYRYTFPEKGILTARLRMSWDLNNSEFTQYVNAHYVEVTGLPPKYIIKKFTDTETLRIGWEEQPYVKYYNVSITIDGVQTTHIVENVSYIDIDMRDKYDKTIKVDIITRFINDVISDKSDPRQWVSTKSNNPTLMLNCNEQHSLFAMSQNIVQTMLEWPYLNYFRITSQFMKDFEIITKFLSTGNIGYYPLETNVWGKALANIHILNTVVYQQGVQTPNLLTTICKNFIEAFNELRMTVYYSQSSNYYLNTEVNKVRIVCFGDSITAG